MYFGAITKGDVLLSMLEDLADLFEQSAANGTPVREIVGDDPVEFAEAFLAQLLGGSVDQQGTGAADQRHRARGRRTPARAGRAMSSPTAPAIRCGVWRSPTRTCTCCAAWTSTWRGAASSPCSAPTARARPRS